MWTLRIIALSVSVLALNALAGDLDGSDQEALQKTQDLLTNPQLRQQAMKGDSSAQNANAQATAAVGAQNVDQVYSLSSGIFQKMVNDTGGDPEKLNKMLEELQRNPAALDSQLTPEQRAQIQGLAQKMEQDKVRAAAGGIPMAPAAPVAPASRQ